MSDEKAHETLPPHPVMYDITTDEMRPVTQADWDHVMERLTACRIAQSALAIPDEESSKPWTFQLALYANVMRPGRVWIAEAKNIEPYNLPQFPGETLYPAVPRTPWIIQSDLDLTFACEIARRWNRVPGQY